MAKPTLEDSRWATDESNNTAPASGQRDTGWTPGQVAVSDYFNVLALEAYRWHEYLDEGILTGALHLNSAISPAAITGSNNDYDPTGWSSGSAGGQVIRQDLSAAATLTGLAGGATGRLAVLVNIHASLRLTLSHEGAGSTAANRFVLPGAVSYYLDPGQSALLRYDSTSSRWRVVGGTGFSAKSRIDVFSPMAGVVMSGSPAFDTNGVNGTAAADKAAIPLHVETGRRITAVRMRGNDAGAASFARGELYKTASDGTQTQIGADIDTNAGATGEYNVAITGLTEDVVSGYAYHFRWEAGEAADILRHVEITTEPTP